MSKKLFLHIGIGKTGTTALQAFCDSNNSKLAEQGFYYLQSAKWGDKSHHLLGFGLWGDKHLKLPNIPKIDITTLFEKLSNEIRALPPNIHSVIISSEILFEIASTKKIHPLLDFIEQHFAETKIICYLRRQDEHLESLYKHWIKTKHSDFKESDITEFLDNYKGDFFFNKLKAWENYFPQKDFILRLYDKSQFEGGSIFSDFFNALSIEFTDDFEIPKSNNSNLSLTSEATELMRLCPDLTFEQLQEIFPQGFGQNESKNSLLPHSIRAKIMEKYATDNELVRQKYFPNKAVLFEKVENDTSIEPAHKDIHQKIIPPLLQIAINQKSELDKIEKKQQLLEAKLNELNDRQTIFFDSQKNTSDQAVFDLRSKKAQDFEVGKDVEAMTLHQGEMTLQSIGKDPFVSFFSGMRTEHQYCVKIILHSACETSCQLFYLTSEDNYFNESHSIVMPVQIGLNEIIFNLNMPNIKSRIRFDFANNTGVYKIKSLLILELDNKQ